MIINLVPFFPSRNGWVNLSRAEAPCAAAVVLLMSDVFHILKDIAAAAAAVVTAFLSSFPFVRYRRFIVCAFVCKFMYSVYTYLPCVKC